MQCGLTFFGRWLGRESSTLTLASHEPWQITSNSSLILPTCINFQSLLHTDFDTWVFNFFICASYQPYPCPLLSGFFTNLHRFLFELPAERAHRRSLRHRPQLVQQHERTFGDLSWRYRH